MEIATQASGALAVISGIVIGILFYYHKQTPAIWVTFTTVVLIALAFCCFWQDKVWKNAEAAKTALQAPVNSVPDTTKDQPTVTPPQSESITPANLASSLPSTNASPRSTSKPTEPPIMKDDKPLGTSAISNSIVNSPIVNSPGSVQAPGGNVTINQGSLPRVLTPEQRKTIISVLRAYEPATIHVLFVVEPETQNYALQIGSAIGAHWKAEPVALAAVMPGFNGVYVLANDSKIRAALVLAFKTAQIQLTEAGQALDSEYPNSVLIATKP